MTLYAANTLLVRGLPGIGNAAQPLIDEIAEVAHEALREAQDRTEALAAEAHAEAAAGNHSHPNRARPASAATPQEHGPPPRDRDGLDAGSER